MNGCILICLGVLRGERLMYLMYCRRDFHVSIEMSDDGSGNEMLMRARVRSSGSCREVAANASGVRVHCKDGQRQMRN